MKRGGLLAIAVVAVLLLMVGGCLVGNYNRLVSTKEAVDQKWAQVDNQLQRRNDLIGNLVDIWVFFFFKKLTGNKMLWLRSTGSTAVSQLIDTFVISAFIWLGKVGFSMYLTIVFTSYLIKLTAACCGCTVRITRKWADLRYPYCPHGQLMAEEQPAWPRARSR